MKSILFILIFTGISLLSFSQLQITLQWKFGDVLGEKVLDGKNISVSKSNTELQKVSIKAKLSAGHTLEVTCAGVTKTYNKTDDTFDELDFTKNIIGQEITIVHKNNANPKVEIKADRKKLKIINDIDDTKDDTKKNEGNKDILPICLSCKINEYVTEASAGFEEKAFGLYEPKTNTIHLFFDHFGNNLLTTVPQGISNAHYKIHIVYPYYNSVSDPISYSVKQKTGTFSGALNFNNSNIRDDLGELIKQSGKNPDGITQSIFTLGTATDDLSFDIIASSQTSKKTVLESYTIRMSPVYHGSFDVGLLTTNLSSPTFNLIEDPNSSDMVVKETNGGSKGVVTLMASFYTSPIVLLKSLLNGKKKPIPFYKLTGRSFLDDHSFFERIYPTIGVSISSKSFENIFYGFNFELARGLNLFGGWNYGKVNVFNMPGYQEGVTAVNQEQFDFYQKTEWKTSTAFGIKVDALIIKTLFGGGL